MKQLDLIYCIHTKFLLRLTYCLLLISYESHAIGNLYFRCDLVYLECKRDSRNVFEKLLCFAFVKCKINKIIVCVSQSVFHLDGQCCECFKVVKNLASVQCIALRTKTWPK